MLSDGTWQGLYSRSDTMMTHFTTKLHYVLKISVGLVPSLRIEDFISIYNKDSAFF